jgi:septal ring factor EnvC (AmiA/AmiB activator)
MNRSKTSDEVMRELNDQAKAQGRYLAEQFSEIPRTPGSLLDRPDTAESDERLRKVQEYIAAARRGQGAAVSATQKEGNEEE